MVGYDQQFPDGLVGTLNEADRQHDLRYRSMLGKVGVLCWLYEGKGTLS